MFTRKSWAPLLAVLAMLSAASCDRKCDTCNVLAPSTPAPTRRPEIRLAFASRSFIVDCRERVTVIGTGFEPGQRILFRVEKNPQDYNDYPSSRESPLFANAQGAWEYVLDYDRFWVMGGLSIKALIRASPETWTERIQFEVLACPPPRPTPTPGPTPGPPGPTPPPTGPTPPPGCTANPSMTVSPKSGQRGSTFTLQAVGFCPNDRVNWVVSGIGVGSATVGSDGTTRWTHRSELSDPVGTKTASVTNQNGRGASDTFTITN